MAKSKKANPPRADKKKKRRIPVPKKPPKIEKSKKTYDRKKEKEKIKKIIRREK